MGFFYRLRLMAKDIVKDSKEEILEMQLQEDEKRLEADEKKIKRSFVIIGGLVIFVIANLVVIYLLVLKPKQSVSEQISQPIPVSAPSPAPSKEPSITTSPSKETTTDTSVKDHFISFGSGTSTSADWTDVGGLQATVDLGGYRNIKEIRFEVSVAVPTANETVWIRLFNKTDNHPVWKSEVSAKGASSYSVSEPILYDKGEKTYQVQMKTQLQYIANLGQSRLHIVLK